MTEEVAAFSFRAITITESCYAIVLFESCQNLLLYPAIHFSLMFTTISSLTVSKTTVPWFDNMTCDGDRNGWKRRLKNET